MVFQLRFQFRFVGYITVVVPPLLGVVASDVPQFGCGESALVEVATNLLVVRDFGDVGAGILLALYNGGDGRNGIEYLIEKIESLYLGERAKDIVVNDRHLDGSQTDQFFFTIFCR